MMASVCWRREMYKSMWREFSGNSARCVCAARVQIPSASEWQNDGGVLHREEREVCVCRGASSCWGGDKLGGRLRAVESVMVYIERMHGIAMGVAAGFERRLRRDLKRRGERRGSVGGCCSVR
ncbi:hypothetical protein CBR_g38812 [Chara braunii]|uniref:Uncharacterized protein n=1 Tax=Chara braunii TaxID=69332 RepID=A0A388LQB1_CHABU|nr:hypothetical protein CBR_g38812 [Chara braunii]|eukprot:GBG84530.1 hypothetical protein CBR_g38812 [Chara braunii]